MNGGSNEQSNFRVDSNEGSIKNMNIWLKYIPKSLLGQGKGLHEKSISNYMLFTYYTNQFFNSTKCP